MPPQIPSNGRATYQEINVIANQNSVERDYWQTQLSGNLEPCHFPYRSDSSVEDGIRNCEYTLPVDLSGKILKVANGAERATHIILQSAVMALLFKVINKPNIVVGTAIYRQTEKSNLINKQLPIRLSFEENWSFQSVLINLNKLINEANQNQNYPVEFLLNDLQPIEEKKQLVDVFVLYNSIHEVDYLEGLSPNLIFVFGQNDNQLTLKVEYNSNAYGRDNIDRIVQNLEHLLILSLEEPKKELLKFDLPEPLSDSFKCFIIGETSLVILCAEELIERQHELQGIITSDPKVQAWCKANKVPTFEYQEELVLSTLKHTPNQYLFSISNPNILSPDILAIPSNSIFNYHDSPLPKYAGLNATSWAILNGESTHGISWHMVDQGIDTGSICQSEEFPIDESESVFSLNNKCYQAALKTFKQLISGLAQNSATYREQDLSKRSFYRSSDRPEYLGWINFNEPADRICRMIGALSFEESDNPLCTAKIKLDKNFYIVNDVTILGSRSNQSSGKVLGVDDSGMIVTTTTNDIRINQLSELNGQLVSMEMIERRHGSQIGSELGNPVDASFEHYSTLIPSLIKSEAFWTARLKQFDPPQIPMGQQNIDTNNGKLTYEPLGVAHRSNNLVAIFAAFIAKLCSQDSFDIWFANSDILSNIQGLDSLVSSCVPLQVNVNMEKDFSALTAALESQLNLISHKSTFSQDLISRYQSIPDYKSNPMTIGVAIFDSMSSVETLDPNSFFIVFDKGSQSTYFAYNEDQLSNRQIELLIGYFNSLAENLNKLSNKPLRDIGLLNEADEHNIVHGFNETKTAYNDNLTIPELFESSVKKSHLHIAAVYNGQHITYNELNRKSNQLARSLRENGLQKGDFVCVTLDRSIEMLISVMAILKAGGAYVPIEPYLPENRISAILDLLSLKFVITDGQNLELIQKVQKTAKKINNVFCWTETTVIHSTSNIKGLHILDTGYLEQFSDENPSRIVESEDIAYIIFTSGSTGEPKGVVVRHKPVINLIEWVNKSFKVGSKDKLLFTTSLGFDLSVYDIFGTLAAGGTVQIVGTKDLQKPSKLVEMIINQCITFWDSAPAALQMLSPLWNNKSEAVSESLRLVFLSGDWVPLSLPDTLKKVFPAVQVVALGGATEATVWSNYFLVDKVKPEWASIPYGKPIENARYYILDNAAKPCPIGVPGDLFIGGECLASGYINQPQMTANRFVDDPFVEHGKMYKTGDLARWCPDGNMEFLGRSDFQVKINGYRVELSEIEAQLISNENVRDAIVLAEGKPTEKQLFAYIIADEEMSAEALKSSLGQHLPEYMIPSFFVQIESFPVTSNGKVDRSKLTAVDDFLKTTADYEAPQTQIEQQLTNIWDSIFGHQEFGVTSNFFDMGGDSLKAIQIIALIEEEFATQLDLRTLFNNPTIKELSVFISEESYEII